MPRLSLLFSEVLVPKAVRADLFKRRATKDRLRSLFRAYSFLHRCDEYDQGTVDLLLAERKRRGMKDRGEAEAVVQASQLGTTVIVDEIWGRKLARRYDLDFHGTLWILRRFHELNLLSSEALRERFTSLRLRGIRLPWETVNELLAAIGQPPL